MPFENETDLPPHYAKKESISKGRLAKECPKTICCATCHTCLNCNKEIVTAILNDPPPKSSPCQWFLITHSLDLSTLFRELFAHITVQECEEFTTGIPSSKNFPIFQIFGNLVQLQKYVNFMFNNLVNHAEVKRRELPSSLSEKFDGVLKTMDRLKLIFEHGVPQEKYLHYLEKAKKIFIEDNKEFYETLKFAESRILKAIDEKKEEIIANNKENKEELKDHVTEIGDTNTQTILDKQETDKIAIVDAIKKVEEAVYIYQAKNGNNRSNIEEEPCTVSGVTLFQHFDEGFVLEMSIEKDRTIEKVEYKYKDESWIEVEAGRKINNENIYLRVEKIKSTGKHHVRVISYLGGVKREDPLVVDVQKLLDKETDYLFTVTPPNEAVPLLHQHWKKDVHVKDGTNLLFTVFDSFDSEDDEQHEKMSDAKNFSYLGVGYLKRNHMNFDKVLKFPPACLIKDDLVKNICDTFSGLLKDEIGLRAMISNYADFKYFQFIHDDTEKAYVETSFSDVPSENRLLLFCSELSTIASIRVVNDKRKILEEMNNCFEDLKCFCYTFKRFINGNIILTILLVCCEISREEIKEEIKFYFNKEFEKRIKFFFLTKDEFGKDGKSLPEDWWKDIFKNKLHKILKNHPPLDREKTEKMFKEILGQCMATIGWCDRESKSRLPTLSHDQHQQILTLLLSDSQLNAINCPEKKKLIYGPFGSGKTIVAETLVRLIYENSLLQKEDTKMKTLIVYAIQDNHSLLEVRNKRFVDRLKKVLRKKRGDHEDDEKVIIKPGTFRSLTGLDGKSLLDFVEDVLEKEKEFSNVNFVLDEVGHESIQGEGDLIELKKNLKNLKKIDHFIIFPRSANLQVQLAGKNKLNESFLYKLFPDDNKYQLEVVMRNSIEIVKAAESCQKSVGPTKSVCKIPVAIHNDVLKDKTVMTIPETQINTKHLNTRDSNAVSSGNLEIENPAENSNQENEVSNAVLSGNHEIENPAENSKQENDDPNAISSGSPEFENLAENSEDGNEDSNSVSSEDPKENKENNPVVATNGTEEKDPFEPGNKYATFRSNSLQAAKEITKKNETPETFETLEFKTSFIKCIPGNNVSNGTPKLINLPLKFDKCSDNGAKILSLILDKICLVKFSKNDSPGRSNDIRSPIIICNEMDEVEIVYYALSLIKRLQDCCRVYVPQLQRKSYSFNKKEKIYDEIICDKKILIADNSSFRGMESQHVITFYNPLETFDRHLLPEIMTRATVSLDIIAFRVDNDTTDVVSNWMGEDVKEERKLVNVINVNISPDRNVENLYALEKEELKIYGQSEDFKEYFRDSVTFNKFKEQNEEEFRITQGPINSSDFLKMFSSESKEMKTCHARGEKSKSHESFDRGSYGIFWDEYHSIEQSKLAVAIPDNGDGSTSKEDKSECEIQWIHDVGFTNIAKKFRAHDEIDQNDDDMKIIDTSLTTDQAIVVRRRIDSLHEVIRQRKSNSKSNRNTDNKQRRHLEGLFSNPPGTIPGSPNSGDEKRERTIKKDVILKKRAEIDLTSKDMSKASDLGRSRSMQVRPLVPPKPSAAISRQKSFGYSGILLRRGGDGGVNSQIYNGCVQYLATAFEQNTLPSNRTPVVKAAVQQELHDLRMISNRRTPSTSDENFGSSTTSPRDVKWTSSDAMQDPDFPKLPNFTIIEEEFGLTHVGDLAEADMVKIRSLALIELTALFDAHNISMNRRKTPTKLKLKDQGTFGVALTTLCAREESKNNNPGVIVPRIFKVMLEYIEKNGLHERGLLSVPGSTPRVKAFTEAADKNPDLSTLKLEEQKITDVTTCLKQFLRDLPVPLLSYEYQNTFTSVSDLPDRKDQLQALNHLILLLHPVHQETLKLFLSFLNKVVINESHNKMGLNDVAMIVAPNLFFNNNAKINKAQNAAGMIDVLRMLIRYQEILWTIPAFLISQIRFLYDAGAKTKDLKALSKSIRRKKMDYPSLSVGITIRTNRPGSSGEELEDFDENLIIRVKAPNLNKQSMAIQLSEFTTVAKVIAKFQWQRKKSDVLEDEIATDRLRISATNKLDVKEDGDCDKGVKFFLYEVGGNIGERRLEASACISAILKENPNAEWVLKSEPL